MSPFLIQFVESVARGIDAGGNIVGYATDVTGAQHAVLRSIVPEASAGLLSSIAPVGCVACLRARGARNRS
jgi:hypothetical protein